MKANRKQTTVKLTANKIGNHVWSGKLPNMCLHQVVTQHFPSTRLKSSRELCLFSSVVLSVLFLPCYFKSYLYYLVCIFQDDDKYASYGNITLSFDFRCLNFDTMNILELSSIPSVLITPASKLLYLLCRQRNREKTNIRNKINDKG